jgi:hypothetical protein
MRIGAHRFALLGLLGLLGLSPEAAKADGTSASAGSASGSTGTVTMAPANDTPAPSAAAPSGSAATAGSAAPAASDAPHTPAPGTEATGYGWSTPKKKKGGHASAARRGASATASASSAGAASPGPNEGEGAVVPGFELLGDGSTRVFVQMPKAVAYTTKVEPNKIVYVLKDLRVDKRNNYNPLVTVHFNTPVTSARLVPHGKDLWLIVALRAKAQPAVAVQAGKDGTSILQVDFPKGEYLPAGAPAAGSDDETPATSKAP